MFCVSPSLPYAQPCYRGRVCNSRETPRQSGGPLAPPQPPSHGTPHSARRGSAERAGDCDSVSQTMQPHSDWYRLHRSVVGHAPSYKDGRIAFLSADRKLCYHFRSPGSWVWWRPCGSRLRLSRGGSTVREGDLSRGESWSCTRYSNLKYHVSAFRARVQRETGVWRGVNFPPIGPCAVLATGAHVSRLGRDV